MSIRKDVNYNEEILSVLKDISNKLDNKIGCGCTEEGYDEVEILRAENARLNELCSKHKKHILNLTKGHETKNKQLQELEAQVAMLQKTLGECIEKGKLACENTTEQTIVEDPVFVPEPEIEDEA